MGQMDRRQDAQEAEACQQQAAEHEEQQEHVGESNEAAAIERHQHRHWGRRPYHQRVYRQQFSYMDLTDDQCLRRLRLQKIIVMEQCNLLQPDLQPQTRWRTTLTIASKVTITHNFYATESFQDAAADTSNISQFTLHNFILQVTDALYKRRRDYVSFPMSREKQLQRQTGFVCIVGFPRVQDAIDCTHVALRAPQNKPEISHGAFILCQTSVPGVFVSPNQDCGWLFGDKGYPLCTWLLTPLHNPRTAAQQAYNHSHSATRCLNEQCIGILKPRFHCLDRSGGVLQYSPEQVCLFVVVCCMLHNLAIMKAQTLEDEAAVPPEEEDREEEVQEHNAQEEEEEQDQDAGQRSCRCGITIQTLQGKCKTVSLLLISVEFMRT
uniref:putative nuclease HARBI1 n=1 Tax=Pristiophorus japonicus TaxID=55135 RepID=UPI00398E70E5